MKKLKLLLLLSFTVVLFCGTLSGEVKANEIPNLPFAVTKEEYLDQKSFRDIHGLDMSDKAIFRALDQNNLALKVYSDHDIRLTLSEWEIVQEIDSMTDYLEEVKEIIGTDEMKYSDFASVYIDTRNQGMVHINIKEDWKGNGKTDEIVDEIISSTPIKEKINISYVKFSEQELRDRQEIIVQDDKLSLLGITSVYVHYEKNTIGIDVEKINPEIISTIKELYGEDIYIEESPEEIKHGRTDPVNYMEGGLAIGSNTDPAGTCTFSYSVRRLSTGENNFVTAGHCASLNQNVYQGGKSIGVVNYSTDEPGGTLDVALITPKSGKNPTKYIFQNNHQDVTIVGTLEPSIGIAVRKSGKSTFNTRGTVTDPHAAVRVDDVIVYRARSNYESAGGDSGAPVYNAARIVGHHTSGNSLTSSFVNISKLQSMLNVRVITD
ncbi:S1 family peptidase [Sporosarcina sp.]|uniref:S1 family peptidase n=1 Tax=Sporosarcina sp. TaxID=49982 RepID=UPI002610854A|nr:S1 family peptidase [Sporosarcina sp.]